MSNIKGIDNELAISDVIPSYSQLQRPIHTLAFNEWQYQLHKCTHLNSESGGKLVLFRQLQFDPVPSNISPGRRWMMANMRGLSALGNMRGLSALGQLKQGGTMLPKYHCQSEFVHTVTQVKNRGYCILYSFL